VNESLSALINDCNASPDPSVPLGLQHPDQSEEEAPDLIAFRRFQEVLHAPRSSSPTAEAEPARPKLPLPSASVQSTGLLRPSKKFLPKNRTANTASGLPSSSKLASGKLPSKSANAAQPASRPSSASAFVKNCLARTQKTPKTSETRSVIKQRKVATSCAKDTEVEATNSMEHVRKTNSHLHQDTAGDSRSTRRRLRVGQESQPVQRYNGKSDLSALRSSAASARAPVVRSDGKWSTDIDSAMNVIRRSSKPLEANAEVACV